MTILRNGHSDGSCHSCSVNDGLFGEIRNTFYFRKQKIIIILSSVVGEYVMFLKCGKLFAIYRQVIFLS